MEERNTLSENHWVMKRNALNEMRANNMTMQELRLFSVYLSRINPSDPETRRVRFTLEEFQSIMDLDQLNVEYYRRVANSLMSKVITLDEEFGGFDCFTLFSRFRLYRDGDYVGKWVVDIIANDDMMPILFEFKTHYFKYELWNALSLKGKYQLRMYEVLKQYENVGYRVIAVEKLRRLLGVDEGSEYQHYKYFKRDILEPCRKALGKHTDIKFTYEPHKKGFKGKIVDLKFVVKKNDRHEDPLALKDFIKGGPPSPDGAIITIDLNDINSHEADELEHRGKISRRQHALVDLREALGGEFSIEQVDELYAIATNRNPNLYGERMLGHLFEKYKLAKVMQSERKIRTSLFRYLRGVISKADASPG